MILLNVLFLLVKEGPIRSKIVDLTPFEPVNFTSISTLSVHMNMTGLTHIHGQHCKLEIPRLTDVRNKAFKIFGKVSFFFFF